MQQPNIFRLRGKKIDGQRRPFDNFCVPKLKSFRLGILVQGKIHSSVHTLFFQGLKHQKSNEKLFCLEHIVFQPHLIWKSKKHQSNTTLNVQSHFRPKKQTGVFVLKNQSTTFNLWENIRQNFSGVRSSHRKLIQKN